MLEGALGFLENDLDVLENSQGLDLEILGDQFACLGVNTDLARNIHGSVEDFDCGVRADCFGTEDGVKGLDKSRHLR